MDPLEKATIKMINDYHGLNGGITVLDEIPSTLDFMRFVAANRPFVIRDGCLEWPAVGKWNAVSLKEAMKGRQVKVAITPNGFVYFNVS